MSITYKIADVAPEPTFALGGTGAAIAIAAVVVLAVALLFWRIRCRSAKTPPESGPAPSTKVEPSPPAPAASSAVDSAPKPTGNEPAFDPEKALGLCGDDDELLRSVVEELPEEIDSQVKILHDALEAEDTHTLHVSAHRLKGSLLLIAAAPSAALALSIELAGRQSNIAEIPPTLKQLDAEVVRLKDAITEYLKANS